MRIKGQQYEVLSLLRFALYPITNLIWNPIALIWTLYNCRILLLKSRKNYNHFNPVASINHLFYRTRLYNLEKFGKTGISTLMGLGNAKMFRNFHYSLASLRPYVRQGCYSLIFGMLAWLLSHFIWSGSSDKTFVLTVIALTSISSIFYGNLFRLQNYNVFGWMFLPLTIFFCSTHQYILATLSLGLMAYFSFTSGIVAIMFAGWIWIFYLEWEYLGITILPALVIASYFIPVFKKEGWKSQLQNLWLALGGSNKVKYKRKVSKGWGIKELYYLSLFTQFIVFYWLIIGPLPPFTIFALLLFVFNRQFARFVDDQSILIITASMAVADSMNAQNYLILISLWILINPIPILNGFYVYEKCVDFMPVLRPVSPDRLLSALKQFISCVPKNAKILMAFNDPQDTYEKIFDGYRNLVEPIDWICTSESIHFIPDWLAVNETNYEGAETFWGTTPKECRRNLEKLDTEFLIVYYLGEFSINEWRNNGFEHMSTFSWNEHLDLFTGIKKPNVKNLCWVLLRRIQL